MHSVTPSWRCSVRNFFQETPGSSQSSSTKVEFGTSEHLQNCDYATHWLKRFNDLVYKYQDSLEEEAYDQRLMTKGMWYGTMMKHETQPIAIYVSFSPPPGRGSKISFCMSLLHPSARMRWELEQSFVEIHRQERFMMATRSP